MTKRTVEETLRQELVAAQKAVTATRAALARAGEERLKADRAEGDVEVRHDAARDRVARTKAALEALLPGPFVEHVVLTGDDSVSEFLLPTGDPVPV